MSINFRVVNSLDDLIKVFVVRGIVFCAEQDIPYSIERDNADLTAVHILGELNNEPVAAGRIRFFSNYAKLERLAVLKSCRGKGFGKKLTKYMLSVAKEQGFSSSKMHAQAYLTEFYKTLGFKTEGEIFQEADIDHVLMVHNYE